MAKAVDFPKRNDYIGKPPTMTDNQCYALPVCRIITQLPGEKDTDHSIPAHAHVSCWELSERELEQVMKDKKVFVKIIGTTLFPMSVHGVEPLYEGEGSTCDKVLNQAELTLMLSR